MSDETIYWRARSIYKSLGEDWWKDVHYYTEHGYAYFTQEYILFAERRGDAWHVQFALGDISPFTFVMLMPYYLPWITWARPMRGRPEIKHYATQRIIELLCASDRARVARALLWHQLRSDGPAS